VVAAALLACLVGCASDIPPARASAPDPAASAAQNELLESKARAFRASIADRHRAAEGFLLYSVDLDAVREQLAHSTYPALGDTPTYTGMLAAAECTRADVETGAERAEALADADRTLAGLEILMRVTGRRGLLARGIQRPPAPAESKPDDRWFKGAPGYEQYLWRGDVSRDQYANGLLPALAACREYFPERVRVLATDVAELLLETEMRLIDPDGRVTRYGELGPFAGLGFNPIAKLTGYAVFALAAELDPDPRFAKRRDELRDRDRVVASSSVTNIRVFGLTSNSNDLMAWNLYRVLVPLAERTRDPALPDLRHGLRRSWLRVKPYDNPYFTLLFCRLEPQACEPEALADARDMLLRFPLEKRRLAPSPRLAELPRALLPSRKLQAQALAPVPIELRPAETFEWKASPYRISSATEPSTEYTGTDYLAAYWLYRGLESARAPVSASDP
jgi:hypothetical protein